MQKTSSLQKLVVFLNDCKVGEIIRLPDDRTIFSFEQSYIDDLKRPTLSLSYRASDGNLLIGHSLQRNRLEPLFSNLLPEGHLRTYLAEKLGIKPQREFFFLHALGEDLPGAIRISAAEGSYEGLNSGIINDRAKHQSEELRFSLAGVQLKFSTVIEANGRLTVPASGQGGFWIVKIPAGRYSHVPDAEFAMMTLAREAKIVVPEFKLVPTQSIEGLPSEFQDVQGNCFAVKRFDRNDDGSRIHMEDFAQVFSLYADDKYKKRSYANIAEVLHMEADIDSVVEFIKRLVFSVGIGNGDMHLKNWSLLYSDPRRPSLSPAYDFIPTVVFLDDQKLGLSLGDSKTFQDIGVENFKRLAAKAQIPERTVLLTVQQSVEATIEAWRKNKSDLPLSANYRDKIEKHMNSFTLFKPKRFMS